MIDLGEKERACTGRGEAEGEGEKKPQDQDLSQQQESEASLTEPPGAPRPSRFPQWQRNQDLHVMRDSCGQRCDLTRAPQGQGLWGDTDWP